MLKHPGISRSSAILGSDSPQSNNRKDNSLWVTPFIPRERPNVKHAIAGYIRLPQPTPAPALMREMSRRFTPRHDDDVEDYDDIECDEDVVADDDDDFEDN